VALLVAAVGAGVVVLVGILAAVVRRGRRRGCAPRAEAAGFAVVVGRSR